MRQAVIIFVSLVIVGIAVFGVRYLSAPDDRDTLSQSSQTDTTEDAVTDDRAPGTPESGPKTESARDEAEAGMAPPSFDVVRVSREGTGVIAGRSAPEAFVEVFADEESIGRVRANRDGEWVLIFEKPLPSGSQKLSLVATLEGEEPVESENVVVVAVPERKEKTFSLEQDDGVVAVLSPRDGVGPSRILQTPGAFREDADLRVDTLDYDESGDTVFTGYAAPGAELRIYLDNWFMGSVKADEAGAWTFEPERQISKGNHVLRLDQILEGDDVEIRIEQPFNTARPIDRELAEGHVIVRPGNSLWHIARRIYGSGILFTQIFQANEGQIRDPDLIYPGQKFQLPRPSERSENEHSD